MNGIGAHTGQTYIQTFIFIYIEDKGKKKRKELHIDGKSTPSARSAQCKQDAAI
jgi:hypothetical protein